MLTCPFCNEEDFDMYGLKLHLTIPGWCNVFANVNEQTDSRLTNCKHSAIDEFNGKLFCLDCNAELHRR